MGNTTKSSISGGGTRVTEHKDNGTSTDRDYNSSGSCVAITEHDKNGNSESFNVGQGGLLGCFGPFKGGKK